MNVNKLTKITLNFLAVVLLVSLITTPIFFAKNAAKVAGVQNISPYLIVSQIEKFPNMTLSQNQDRYQIAYTKQAPSQAFLGILILNNPTDSTQTYQLQVISGQAKPFFGEDLQNQLTTISVPPTASIPISLLSSDGNPAQVQTVEFTIKAN